MNIDDDTLMAYADGLLDAGTRARVDRALATDPTIAARLSPFLATRELLSALDATLDEPLPGALRQAALPTVATTPALDAARVTEQPRPDDRPERRRSLSDWLLQQIGGPRGLAAAAVCLVAGTAIGPLLRDAPTAPTRPVTGSTAGQDRPPLTVATGPAPDGPLTAVLDGLRSGQRRTFDGDAGLPATRTLAVGSTLRVEGGGYCREYLDTRPGPAPVVIRGLACRGPDDGWRVRAQIAEAASVDAGTDYRPAGSGTAAFDALIDAIAPGTALSPADETALIARDWRE